MMQLIETENSEVFEIDDKNNIEISKIKYEPEIEYISTSNGEMFGTAMVTQTIKQKDRKDLFHIIATGTDGAFSGAFFYTISKDLLIKMRNHLNVLIGEE